MTAQSSMYPADVSGRFIDGDACLGYNETVVIKIRFPDQTKEEKMKRAIMKYAVSALGIAAMLAPAAEAFAATGKLKNEDGKWLYYEGDEWISDKYGFVDHNNSRFLVANGVVADSANGIQQDPEDTDTWYFCSRGQVQLDYSGLAEYDNAWFLLKDGVLDTSVSDFVEYDGGLFFIAAGRLVKEQNGLAMDPDDPTSWYYCSQGQAQTSYTGLAAYDGEWFYVINGKQAIDYTGTVEYDGAEFYVINGMVGEKPAEPTPTPTVEPTPTATPTPTPSGKTYSRWRMTTRKYYEKSALKEVTVYEYVDAHTSNRSGTKVYDGNNNLKSYTVITRDNGDVTTKYFNADGTLDRYTVTSDNGNKYSYYDGNGVLYYYETYKTIGETSVQTEGGIYDTDTADGKEVYTLIGKAVYEYDSTGRRVKETDSYSDGQHQDSVTEYKYNADYTSADILVDGVKKSCETYNSEGALLRQDFFKEDGSLDYYYTYTYNDEHEESSRMWYNGDGSLNFGYRYTYSYNSKGKIEEETSIRVNSDGSEQLNGRYVYTYDTHGNRSSYTQYGSDDKEASRYEYEYEKYTYTK